MTYRYEISPLQVSRTPEFTDATAEELRVLLALIEAGGTATRADLAAAAHVSETRLSHAVSLWEAAGVIRPDKQAGSDHEIPQNTYTPPAVTYEFPERVSAGGIDEEDSVTVARQIREEGLASLLSDLASMMNKPSLSDSEVKQITALHTQYALDEEYILSLAADLASRAKLTVRRIVNKAIRNVERGIDTPAELNMALQDRDSVGEWERAVRRLTGIYDRALSDPEREFIRIWTEDYGFTMDIIREAYGIATINTGTISFPYMDTVMKKWHECGCRTLQDCRRQNEIGRTAPEPTRTPTPENRPRAARTAPAPRYGNFDPEEAFRRALERSYSDMDGAKDTTAASETPGAPGQDNASVPGISGPSGTNDASVPQIPRASGKDNAPDTDSPPDKTEPAAPGGCA